MGQIHPAAEQTSMEKIMKTFDMALRDGKKESTKYHSLVYTRMNGVYHLALHKSESKRHWFVSHPSCGALVLTVTATHKGCPVASGFLTVKQAREFAMVDLDRLVDLIGFDRFDKTMTNPKPF